ncbi:MAG: YggS family pyridoxal phosphate-dependent enzyme [Desulfobulbaceae bacterium]
MICENIKTIRRRIAEAAERTGRDPEEVRLLAVSKRVDVSRIEEAHRCGQNLFGENFVQEARDKIPLLDPSISWHFIGHLQTNKAGTAARFFDLIETVDRVKLARALNRHAGDLDKRLKILVQVNISREKQKSGVLPEEAEKLLRDLRSLEHLRVCGLMGMPPLTGDPEQTRPFFRELKKMADEFTQKGYFTSGEPPVISMGMSGDFTVAVEEGSTLVRVGTAIFGKRT